MKEELNSISCNRQTDLVSFLYEEMADAEKVAFQSHMQDCSDCKTQYAAFTGVRKSVAAWRDESILGSIGALTSSATQPATVKPSAFAALREFFNLSPLWLKGAVAVASLLFCLMAALAVIRFRDTPTAPLATNQSVPQQKEITPAKQPPAQQEIAGVNAPSPNNGVVAPSPERITQPRRRPRQQSTSTNQIARRPLSKTERQELAKDLRLVELGNESDLELLSDRINQ